MKVADRIEKSITRIPESGCWIWDKAVNINGYGRILYDGKSRYAHRISYEINKGQIPEGLELDHVCKVRCCVNPDHLEMVNRRENMRRSSVWYYRKTRTHCTKGHELTEENKYTTNALGNKYLCLECKRQRGRNFYHKGK